MIRARKEHFGVCAFDTESFAHYYLTDAQSSNSFHPWPSTVGKNDPRILSAPIKLYFDITTKCNLSCTTCLNSSGKSLDDEMSTPQALKTIEGLHEDGVFYIKFSGGEPTTRDGWFDILSAAKELEFTIGINTNGLYSAKTLDKLVSLNLDVIDISLDGFGKTHETIRGPNTFLKTVESIQELHKQGQSVTINSVITTEMTNDDIHRLTELAANYCEDICFFYPRPIGRAQNHMTLMPTFDEVANTLRRVKYIKSQYNFLTKDAPLLPSEKPADVGLLEAGINGFTRFNIMSDGRLYAGGCVPYITDESKYTKSLGNIVSENFSISHVWNHSPELWAIREESVAFQARCDKCDLYQKRCDGFTLEMEDYREAYGFNPFCMY